MKASEHASTHGMVSVLLVAHAAHAAALSMTQDEVDECQGWLSGVRDTYVDQELMALGRRTKNHSKHIFSRESKRDSKRTPPSLAKNIALIPIVSLGCSQFSSWSPVFDLVFWGLR